MHTLPKRALAVACAAALLGTGTSALAAESVPASAPSTGISVQLDGRNLSFPDAAPEARDGRTFLPVRTVFEAMGAEVSYSPSAQTITAVRDGTTVTMALGGTTATVERDGVTTHIPMDAAPYAHDNRTYVPVRFAAQAFGCAVGWDAGDRTVILIDTQKLVDEALDKYDFTYLEKYLAYGQKYRTGIWDMNADFDGSMDMSATFAALGMENVEPLTFSGTVEGTVADSTRMDVAMTLLMDLRGMLEALSAGDGSGMSSADTALLDSLAKEGITLDIRGDLETGDLYIGSSGAFMEAVTGAQGETWFAMHMADFYSMSAHTFLMELTTGDVDYTALLSLLLSTVEPDDKDTAYSELTQAVDLAAQLLRDDAWAVSGNDRILHYALEQDGVAADFTFTLTMRGDDVSAYDLSVELSADVDGSAPMSISLQESMDADGRMEASMQCDAAGLMDLEFSMSGRYTEGKTAPETEPPKGAVVVDLTAPEAPADPVPTSGDPAEVVIDKIYTTGGGFIGVTEG